MNYIAEEGRITATLDLEQIKSKLEATDNSGVVSLSSVDQLTSPHTFSEGITTVIYVAEDPTGNKAYCHFKVSVQGNIYIKLRPKAELALVYFSALHYSKNCHKTPQLWL